jgi:hypothetical protein
MESQEFGPWVQNSGFTFILGLAVGLALGNGRLVDVIGAEGWAVALIL